jgi:hypothetical protein
MLNIPSEVENFRSILGLLSDHSLDLRCGNYFYYFYFILKYSIRSKIFILQVKLSIVCYCVPQFENLKIMKKQL